MKLVHVKKPVRWRNYYRQRGVVLYMALIALVVLMLASVALVRTVNTSAMIAGNLAMKQSATISGDHGLYAGARATRALGLSAPPGLTASIDAAHPYNVTNAAQGYYSTLNLINLTDSAPWNAIAVPPVTDASGNSIQYIVERLCRLGTVLQSQTNCLFNIRRNEGTGGRPEDQIGLYYPGNQVIFRITARVTGANNTLSYVQSIYF